MPLVSGDGGCATLEFQPTGDLLTEFLECQGVEDSERLLERLIWEQAAPVVERIISFKIPGSFKTPDAPGEDVRGDVLADLIARLRELKDGEDRESIRDFRAYTAVAAYNGCHEYYRRCFPQRHRLESRLRYLLGSHPRLALWISTDGEWTCGTQAFRDDGPAPAESRGEAMWATSREAGRLVEAILEERGAPMAFHELVQRVAEHWSVSDRPEPANHTLADEIASVETKLVRRDGLKLLWTEIARLPLAQRISLLLHMREEGGGPALTLLPLTGVATVPQIAAILEMPEGELAQLWNGLPVDDLSIAARLSLNRQQVINLRRSARERLKRTLE